MGINLTWSPEEADVLLESWTPVNYKACLLYCHLHSNFNFPKIIDQLPLANLSYKSITNSSKINSPNWCRIFRFPWGLFAVFLWNWSSFFRRGIFFGLLNLRQSVSRHRLVIIGIFYSWNRQVFLWGRSKRWLLCIFIFFTQLFALISYRYLHFSFLPLLNHLLLVFFSSGSNTFIFRKCMSYIYYKWSGKLKLNWPIVHLHRIRNQSMSHRFSRWPTHQSHASKL